MKRHGGSPAVLTDRGWNVAAWAFLAFVLAASALGGWR